MDIKTLLDKPGYELTEDEFNATFTFKRNMYPRLLRIVKGKSRREQDQAIEKLSFDERVDLILNQDKTSA